MVFHADEWRHPVCLSRTGRHDGDDIYADWTVDFATGEPVVNRRYLARVSFADVSAGSGRGGLLPRRPPGHHPPALLAGEPRTREYSRQRWRLIPRLQAQPLAYPPRRTGSLELALSMRCPPASLMTRTFLRTSNRTLLVAAARA